MIRFWKRNALGDLFFDAGSRLRISSDLGWYDGKWRDGPFVIWIRWGWRAQWQCGIRKYGFPWVFVHHYR